MSLKDHARIELEKAGLFDEDSDYNGMLGDAVMELIATFADQGHSGFSANMCVKLFNKLAQYEPLGPLTGEEDEWQEVEDGLYQNIRCGRIFATKDVNGDYHAWDIDGVVFREPDGSCYTSSASKVPVEFPYTPKTEYQDVSAKENED